MTMTMRKFQTAFCLFTAMALLFGCGEDEKTAPIVKPYIAVIPKGTQHPFWQAVYAGARSAAERYDVTITFEGLPLGAKWQVQAEMMQAALAKKAAAVCIAPFGPEYLNDQLRKTKAAGVPVIIFDSPLSDAPDGTVTCTLATDNAKAGAMAAEEFFATSTFQKQLQAADAANPITIGVIQDTDSNITNLRSNGFVAKAEELAAKIFPDGVQILRNGDVTKPAKEAAKVIITVEVSPTSSYDDLQVVAAKLFSSSTGLAAVFCTTEGAAMGVISASRDGVELDRETGAYKNVLVIGFESGAMQKLAISKRYFFGAITQDAFRIGYLSVETAAKAVRKEAIAPNIDTGVRFYTADTINDPEISGLLYD